jgi:predicted AAA+ superfamily ATPase
MSGLGSRAAGQEFMALIGLRRSGKTLILLTDLISNVLGA